MEFDLSKIPFSRYGSYLTISYINKAEHIKEGLYIRSVRGGDNDISHLFFIEVTYSGKTVPFEAVASPVNIRLKALEGYVDICICEKHLIRAVGHGVGLRLSMEERSYDNALPVAEGNWEINCYSEETKFRLVPLAGSLKVDAPWDKYRSKYVIADFLTDEKTNGFECALEEYMTVWKKRNYGRIFEDCKKDIEKHYCNWLDKTLTVKNEFLEGRELASYITWSCVVPPKGLITRHAMYMSKNWMTNIWSWDNCFNAMALIKNQPELAWDQIMLFVDNQDESGVFPDFINDKFMGWSCCKPPIQGWIFLWMMKRTDVFTMERIQEIYEPLCRWTNWWFEYRDDDMDGVPQYNHGNDCGWDNSTVFNKGIPVESPDLSAYLIIQMDVLAYMAEKLGKYDEHKMWKLKSDELLEKMIQHFWCDDDFCALLSGNHEIVKSQSLLLYIPIILGKKLPEHILESLIKGLKDESKFLTEHGLSTESVSSEHYIPDGYWRGPRWAPSTILITDGLLEAGEKEFSKEIAQRFCKMAQKSGMAENFNALTGEGLRDEAFTWTSSIFLILGNEYC
ncbi:hypothetical protein SDC9_74578 [bioreactor metagenome]|uniref:Mannosylglycerate hydrolase MGH1-like glycoside hydrolase domain-containing protein n=1 Tax=bioreactor metagenome TaxID=1076179 RepID=A0A644YJJ2_9ZZZZ